MASDGEIDVQDEAYIGLLKLIRVDGFWLSTMFGDKPEGHRAIKDIQMGDNDILIASFPKSGTAWMERIVSLIKMDVNVTETDKRQINKISRLLDLEGPGAVRAQPEPRLIKTHYPYAFLPRNFRQGKGKILYIIRNPKDVSVSLYWFRKATTTSRFQGSFDDFFRLFMEGKVTCGPWYQHVKGYWEHRHDDNLKVIFYEDLQKEPLRVIREISAFLRSDLGDAEVATIAAESSFERMKTNPQTNYEWLSRQGWMDISVSKYMRKGVIGDWKNFYSPQMNADVDTMVRAELETLGLNFCYE